MNQDNYNVTRNHIENTTESIDLIDIFLKLWKGKVTIIAFIIVTVVLAVIYLFVAKEKWTSTAVIAQPDAAQVAAYNNALNVIYGSASPNITDVQIRVIGRLSSALSVLSEILENQEIPEKLTIEQAVKGQPLPLKVTYVGESAESAQKQLAVYIQQADEKIADELDVDLKSNIRLQIKTLEDSLQTQEKVAQEQKELRIRQIAEALKFAHEAKITKPQIQQTQDVTQETMVLLGSDALQSMITNESTRPLILSGMYYQIKQNLIDIQKIKVDPTSIHAYRYVMKPNLPIRRDSPKRVLTLILAALIGGMLGSAFVLGRNALRNHSRTA